MLEQTELGFLDVEERLAVEPEVHNGTSYWNTKAVKSSFDDIDTDGFDNHLVFRYLLWNTMHHDCCLGEDSSIQMMVKLAQSRNLCPGQGYVRVVTPIFLPARRRGERVPFSIHMAAPYRYPSPRPRPEVTQKERQQYRRGLFRFVSTELANLDGFVLFDSSNTFRVDFARGW